MCGETHPKSNDKIMWLLRHSHICLLGRKNMLLTTAKINKLKFLRETFGGFLLTRNNLIKCKKCVWHFQLYVCMLNWHIYMLLAIPMTFDLILIKLQTLSLFAIKSISSTSIWRFHFCAAAFSSLLRVIKGLV